MQETPLTLAMILRRTERLFGDKALMTGPPAGSDRPVERTTYGAWAERTRRVGGVLDALGVAPDARVGTFAWNTARHLELYFGIPCTGRILHTLNIRLFAEQLSYIINHAADELIFIERSLLPLLWPLAGEIPTVRHLVVIDDGAAVEIPDDPRVLDYEKVLAAASPVEHHIEDERLACAMCYTSGTTGNPKGVVYSHRSTVLHAMGTMMADSAAVCERDIVLPVVPLFHANGWGLAHSAAFAGASLVLPGSDLSPKALARLIVEERVTLAAGVPTIWMGLLPELVGRDTSALTRMVCGGSAVPKALSESYRREIGLPILQAWGMTETNPVASMCRLRSTLESRSEEEQADIRASQGVIVPCIDVRIIGPAGDEVRWDGTSRGELQVSGPWIARGYYDDPRSPDSFTDDGWLRTGDVATMSPEGYIRLVDRSKDVIKSGGEWISSVDLENEIMGHPDVAEAAVIAVPDPKWAERPLACVVCKPGTALTEEQVIEWLRPRVARWWLPDRVVFVEEIPKTSVGKFSKKDLRDRFGAAPSSA